MALTNRDQFHFVESILENVPTSQDEAGRQLKATLDHLANTAGMPSAR
jgi:predicted mannosyl-3-phosphoglycerate phosphatase (HAD superfamily)